jgi:hypothetical protein
MTTFPGSPRTIKGGLVTIDPTTSAIQRVIVLQYNADTLTRSLQVQGAGGESGGRAEPLRLKGPPVETIKLDAEIDAADQLEFPDQNQDVVQFGIYPQLAALETLVYPASSDLQTNRTIAAIGTLEIAPMEAPLVLFIWSKNRVVPVRITEFNITEEAFDPSLNPLRARVSLGLRVLSVNDLGFDHKGASLYMAYQQQKERLAGRSRTGGLGDLGIRSIP